jgi:hypothetical protein
MPEATTASRPDKSAEQRPRNTAPDSTFAFAFSPLSRDCRTVHTAQPRARRPIRHLTRDWPRRHPQLLPLFDSGEADGLLFYVMPFVEGESLRARLDREKQLPVDEAVRIASAVAAALDYADSNGVIRGSAFATRSWTSSAEFNAPGRGECAPGMRAHHALTRDRWARSITNRCS